MDAYVKNRNLELPFHKVVKGIAVTVSKGIGRIYDEKFVRLFVALYAFEL